MAETPEARYAALAEALADVSDPPAHGTGFGSTSLKTGGRIFAMLSNDHLVVKLPAVRVAELIASGAGGPFDANKGRPMKEWLTVHSATLDEWLALAREAREFVALNQQHRSRA
jgi:hypothetical protein